MVIQISLLYEFERSFVGTNPFSTGAKKIIDELPYEYMKDVVIAFPQMVMQLWVKFDRPGLNVWHCHILSHEDNEMLRPLLNIFIDNKIHFWSNPIL